MNQDAVDEMRKTSNASYPQDERVCTGYNQGLQDLANAIRENPQKFELTILPENPKNATKTTLYMQYAVKKQITVSFIRYDGTNHDAIIAFTENTAKYVAALGSSSDGGGGLQSYSKLSIPTKEGEIIISEGDYVIQEPFPSSDIRYYSCRPEIFLRTFDLLEKIDRSNPYETLDPREIRVIGNGSFAAPLFFVDDNGIGCTRFGIISFCKGATNNSDRPRQDGFFTESLLQVCIEELNQVNQPPLNNRHTSLAITKIEEAIHRLEDRRKSRQKNATIGTDKP